jgi:hypothetical protein
MDSMKVKVMDDRLHLLVRSICWSIFACSKRTISRACLSYKNLKKELSINENEQQIAQKLIYSIFGSEIDAVQLETDEEDRLLESGKNIKFP